MNKIPQWKLRCLLALLVMLAILLTSFIAMADDTEDALSQQQPALTWSDDLSYVKHLLRTYSYYDLDKTVLNAKDVPALIKELQKVDPWADYFSAEELKEFVAEIEGEFVGIGIYVDTSEDKLMVQGVIANSPAEKAGLKYGDIIVGVDKLAAPKASADELLEALSGEENSLLTIKYQRDGRIIEETMNRKKITMPSMEYWLLENNIGYLQIEMFTSHTGEELDDAIKSLKKRGMQALMIDLRYCPGGELDGAVASSGVLVGAGPMMFFVDSDGWYSFAPVDEDKPLNLPLAVLINSLTASAAETVAANVQDSGAGILIGEPSFGKGVMQELVDLPSGAGIKFTTSKIITRGYQDIDLSGGLMPDIYTEDEEAQYEQALNWLKEQMAKPSFLKFYVGLPGCSLGGDWQSGASGALLIKDAAFVPLDLTLTNLGWQKEQRDSIDYYRHGNHRLIVDKAKQKLILATGSQTLNSQEGILYLPAALLRQYGHQVTWDGGQRSVRIDK